MNTYKVIATLSNGEKLDLTTVITELTWEEPSEEIAHKASIEMANTKYNGKYLSSLLKMLTVVAIYSHTGAGYKELLSGIIWDRNYTSNSSEKIINITVYDKMIYSQKSKDNMYFTEGSRTKDVITNICKKWGIPLKYDYESVTHSKIINQEMTISEMILKVLKEAQTKTGKKYVINFFEGALHIEHICSNTVVYEFRHDINTMSTKSRTSLDDLITEVQIKGKETDDAKTPILSTIKGKTEYGVIREFVSTDDNTTLEAAKKEGQEIIDNKGKPTEEYTVEAVDVPEVKRGDKVKVLAGDMYGYYWVKGLSHEASKLSMTMELERV